MHCLDCILGPSLRSQKVQLITRNEIDLYKCNSTWLSCCAALSTDFTILDYIGNKLTQFFISFLTWQTFRLEVTCAGALFHTRIASLIQVFFVRFLRPISTGLSLWSALVLTLFVSADCCWIFSGQLSTFRAFQISNSLI